MDKGSVGKFIYKGKVRRFNYYPRFYNESKEFLEQRKFILGKEKANKEGYVSKVQLGMFQSQRVKRKQSVSDILGSNFLFVLILISIPVAWLLYGELALWMGGLCLTIPLLIKLLYWNGFFQKGKND